MLIEYVLWFIILWIPAMAITHELCHALECRRQGGHPNIKIWWHGRIPSMLCECSGIPNRALFYFAGGVYNSIFLFILAVFLNPLSRPLSMVLVLYSVMQFCYGLYEDSYTYLISQDRKKYMLYKNCVYVLGFTIGLLFIWILF